MNATCLLKFKLVALLGAAMILLNSGFAHAADLEDVELQETPVHTGQYEFTFLTSYRTTYGRFDPYGAYQSLPDGASVTSLMHSLAINSRFTHEWEASMSIMAVEGSSNYASGSSDSTSIGSPSVQVRYHTNIEDVAHITLSTGLSAPYRYSHSNVEGNPQEDSINDNIDGPVSSWTGRFGVTAAHEFKESKIRLSMNVTTSYFMPESSEQAGAPTGTPEVTMQRGQMYSVGENMNYALTHKWGLIFGFRQVWAGDTTADNSDVAGTASRLFTTNMGVNYQFTHWRLSGTYQTAYPFYSDAVNEPYAPSVAVAVMYDGI